MIRMMPLFPRLTALLILAGLVLLTAWAISRLYHIRLTTVLKTTTFVGALFLVGTLIIAWRLRPLVVSSDSLTREQPYGVFVEHGAKPPSESLVNEGPTRSSAWVIFLETEQGFEADIYPSLKSSAAALGRAVGRNLSPAADEQNMSTPVWISGQDIDAQVLDAVGQGLRQVAPSAVVSVGGPTSSPQLSENDGSAVVIKVSQPETSPRSPAPWDRKVSQRAGVLSAIETGPDGQFSHSLSFADKPWVESFAAFVARYPSHRWLLGRSQTLAPDPTMAEREALAAAADALMPTVNDQLRSSLRRGSAFSRVSDDPADLRRRLALAIEDLGLVADRFAQSFERPYGRVWREAMLIDASPHSIRLMAKSLAGDLARQRKLVRSTAFSIAVLLALILLTFGFLNLATRGCYTWAVGAMAITALSEGVLLILILA